MDAPANQKRLSTIAKWAISLALVFYLGLLFLGPLSNPVGSEWLTRPLAKKVRPLHRALFLGHGYRFFAPDPGPSHLVEFEIAKDDGSVFSGRFPDRDDDDHAFPRLQYHRWFMLSETIWSEHSTTPIEADFLARQQRLEKLAIQKKIAGHHDIAKRLRADIVNQKRNYEMTRKRIDELVRSVARNLLQMHGGTKIRLYVREREIPFPIEVEEGAKLNDSRYLKPERPPLIGEFTTAELEVSGGGS